MNISPLEEENSHKLLGKRDTIIEFSSIWLIYKIDIFDKKGLWEKFKKKINELEEKNLIDEIKSEELIEFFSKNSDIEFEMHVWDDVLKKHSLLKINDKFYFYSIGKKSKRLGYIRFYFDINKFLNC